MPEIFSFRKGTRFPSAFTFAQSDAMKNKSGFESAIHKYHDEVFDQIDCKECGLCCRNISPIFRKSDIKHICDYIGTPEKPFKEKYLMQDPDGVGFMLKKEP